MGWAGVQGRFPSQRWGRKLLRRSQWAGNTLGAAARRWCQALKAQVSGGVFSVRTLRGEFSPLVQLPSHVRLCDPTDCSMPGSPVLYNIPGLLRLTSIEALMPSNHFVLCHPLLLLPSVFPSIRVFSNKSALLIRWPKYWSFGISRWPKYWSFSISISPSNECSGLISFGTDWFDPFLFSVQFSRSVMSDSLRPHELQHARPPCLSPTPGVHSDSSPSSR